MAVIAQDNFTGTNGASLIGRTSSSGHTWQLAFGTTGTAEIQSNRGRATADDFVLVIGTPSTADYYAKRKLVYYGDTNNQGVCVRAQAGNGNRYNGFRSSSGFYSIYKSGAGAGTMGTNVTIAYDEAVDMTLSATGTSPVHLELKVQRVSDSQWLTSGGTWQVGETACITHDDSSSPITGAGQPGVYCSTSDGASTGSEIDDFDSQDIGAVTYDEYDPAGGGFFFSPYNWELTSGQALAVNPGAYMKLAFEGTDVRVQIDGSYWAGFSTFPVVRWTVDDGPFQTASLTDASTEIVLATALDDEDHEVYLVFESSDYTKDRWITPNNSLRITSIGISTGGSINTPVTYADSAVVFSDSTGEGAHITGSTYRATECWPLLLRDTLQCEVGVVAFGGQGWARAASGGSNVPTFHNPADTDEQTWRWYYNGSTRLVAGLFDPEPVWLLVGHGKNDALNAVATATVEASIADALPDLRAAAGADCYIGVIIPFGAAAHYRTNITAATDAYAAGDDRCFLLDVGVTKIAGVADDANAYSPDGVHPNALLDAQIAPALALDMIEATAEGGGGGGDTTVTGGSPTTIGSGCPPIHF